MTYICKIKDGFYPYYIKQVDGDFYYYNIATNGIFLIDKEAYEILVDDMELDSEKHSDLKQFFKENFILKTPENDKVLNEIYDKTVSKKKTMKATSLTLMVCQECNLRCKYCYGEGGEYSHRGKMELSTAKKAIDYLISQSDEDKLSICFFGGEPLLNLPLIKEVIAYTKVVEEQKRKKFTFCMTTNATLINEEIEQFIKENDIRLTVSMDGNKATNDSNRFYANKKGIYDDIVEKSKNIKDYITIRATVAPPNLDIVDNVTHLIDDLGFGRVAWAEADNLLSEEDYHILLPHTLSLINKLDKMIQNKQYIEVKKYHSFINILEKMNHDGVRTKGCGAGTNMMAVDIDGKIYPCHRFVGIEDNVLGNVDSGIYPEIEFFSQVHLGSFDKCTNCIAKSVCGGGCINENYSANNNITIPSQKHCDYKVAIFDRMLECYIKMDDEAKEKLL